MICSPWEHGTVRFTVDKVGRKYQIRFPLYNIMKTMLQGSSWQRHNIYQDKIKFTLQTFLCTDFSKSCFLQRACFHYMST